jgi:hypothetical protein
MYSYIYELFPVLREPLNCLMVMIAIPMYLGVILEKKIWGFMEDVGDEFYKRGGR